MQVRLKASNSVNCIILNTSEIDLSFIELEISAVVHINTNNNQPQDALEKRKSFADMKMVKVTNQNLQSIEVFIWSGEERS